MKNCFLLAGCRVFRCLIRLQQDQETLDKSAPRFFLSQLQFAFPLHRTLSFLEAHTAARMVSKSNFPRILHPGSKRRVASAQTEREASGSGQEFSVVVPLLAEPLFTNVQSVDNQVIVHSFSRKPNGRRGILEACGLVRRGDVVLGVNDCDFASCSFEAAVCAMRLAAGEVVVHFKRPASHSLVEVGNFRGVRALLPDAATQQALLCKLDAPVHQLPEALPAADLQKGTVLIPPLRMASRGGLLHRPSSTTTGVIRTGASRVGEKHQVHPDSIPAYRGAAVPMAPSRMLVASADPSPESVPLGGLQVSAPPSASQPPPHHKGAGIAGHKRLKAKLQQLLALFPYWQQEQVLFAVFVCQFDLVRAISKLQAQMERPAGSAQRSSTGVESSPEKQHLPLIRGQFWRSWNSAQVLSVQGALERHGKELRLVARGVAGRSMQDTVAWYYAAWKTHPDYSAWKAACQAFKVQTAAKDWHAEECCVCGQGGDLLCCDWCPGAFHPRCVGGSGVADTIIGADGLDDPWMCPVCVSVFRGWQGVSRSTHALRFAAEEQARHETLALHWKSVRGAVAQTRADWRTDKQSVLVNPPLQAAQAAGGAATETAQVLQGESTRAAARGARDGSLGGQKQKQAFTFVMGGRKRRRARA